MLTRIGRHALSRFGALSRATLAAVAFGSSFWFSSALTADDFRPLSAWRTRRQSPAPIHREPVSLGFDDDRDEFPLSESHSGESIERTAYQTQYPLPSTADELQLDERRRQALTDELSDLPDDECLENDGDRSCGSWIEWEKSTGQATWLAPSSDGLGVTTLDLRGSIVFRDCSAVWFVPRFGWNLLDGPPDSDLPPRLVDFSWETVALIPVSVRFFFQTAIAPSLYSDLDNTRRGALRLPGRVLGFFKYSDALTFSAGVLYLDRDDVKWVPVAGLVWNATDDWKFELVAPRPRVAWRCSYDGERESWLYAVGEFGGGTWAVRRAAGANDVATLRDYRLMLGFERRLDSPKTWLIEAGYVFNRRLEFTSGTGDRDLPATALIRVGFTF